MNIEIELKNKKYCWSCPCLDFDDHGRYVEPLAREAYCNVFCEKVETLSKDNVKDMYKRLPECIKKFGE